MEESSGRKHRGTIKFAGTQQTIVKALSIGFGGLLLLIVLIWGGVRGYEFAESRHSSRRAAGYLSGGDLQSAALSVRRAIELDSTNVGAMELMAQIAEASNDRSAMEWRRKALAADPGSTEKLLALARSALQFNDVGTAQGTLNQVAEKDRETAAFQAASAQLAATKKDFREAERLWLKVSRLAPENKSYRLQLGISLLQSNDAAKRENGLSILEELRHDEKQRVFATRALIADGIIRRSDPQQLLELARELQSFPEAGFNDRLLYAEILRQLHDPSFSAYLTELETHAPTKPTDLASLLSWMNANRMSLLGVDLANRLSGDVIKRWPVPFSLAESYAKLADWARLEDHVRSGNWGELDFLRHAYLALALRNQNKAVAADKEWSLAEKQASARPEFLSILTRTTSDWRWEKEWSDLVWSLTKQPAAQLEALQILYQKCVQDGDTPELHRVLMRLTELQPNDASVQNNFAQVSLLLNADVEKARKIAATLYQKDPANPAYVSTYAFALFSKGDKAAALQVMKSLPKDQLLDPSVAAYYGVILVGAGELAEARKYLDLGKTARLLPEEKELLKTAEEKMQ